MLTLRHPRQSGYDSATVVGVTLELDHKWCMRPLASPIARATTYNRREGSSANYGMGSMGRDEGRHARGRA